MTQLAEIDREEAERYFEAGGVIHLMPRRQPPLFIDFPVSTASNRTLALGIRAWKQEGHNKDPIFTVDPADGNPDNPVAGVVRPERGLPTGNPLSSG